MAPVVTSYTPTTGPVTGGTTCVITGTGLATVDAVLVGSRLATIVGTPGATTLTFRTPAGASATAQKVTVLDNAAGTETQAATSFTYTAVSASEALANTLANKLRIDVRATPGTGSWTKVRGITTAKSAVDYATEDDSDFDSGIWGSTLTTGLGWSLAFTVKRGRGVTSGTYDPGQQILFAAHDAIGSGAVVEVRWYDRTATVTTDEAYTGTANVQWSPQGGNRTSDKVDVTLAGQGARTKIDNPVIADPTLAA